jgi:hypothetical protein
MAVQLGDVAPDFKAETTEGLFRTIAGSVSDDEAKKTYPQGWKAPRPYLRIVPQPRS